MAVGADADAADADAADAAAADAAADAGADDVRQATSQSWPSKRGHLVRLNT